jgi:hypothetical protein
VRLAFGVLIVAGGACGLAPSQRAHVHADIELGPSVDRIETVLQENDAGLTFAAPPHAGEIRDWVVEVLATGQKNGAAQGSEVWLFDTETPEEKSPWLANDWQSPSSDWISKQSEASHGGQALVAIGNHEQRVGFHLRGTRLTLRLLRHPWSGIVRISINGQVQTADLYSPTSSTEVLEFGHESVDGGLSFDVEPTTEISHLSFSSATAGSVKLRSVEVDGAPVKVLTDHDVAWTNPPQPRPWQFVMWWLGLMVLVVFGAAVLVYPTNASTRRLAALSALAAGLLASGLTLIAYPGYLSGDSVDQWGQALQDHYSTWHPPIMAMLMHATQVVSKTPWAFTFGECAVFYFSLFWATSVAVQNRRVWLLASVILAAHPVLWVFSTTLWKDVWTASMALLGLGFTLRFLKTRSTSALVGLAAFFALALCFRHNAVTLIPVPLAAVFFAARNRTFLTRTAMVGVMTIGMMAPTRLVSRLPTVEAAGGVTSSDLATPYVFGIVARVPADAPDFQELHDSIDSTFGDGVFDTVRAEYTCACSLYLVYGATALGAPNAITTHRAYIEDALWKLARKHPMELLQHRMCSLSAFMQVNAYGLTYFPYVTDNRFGLNVASFWPKVRASTVGFADAFSRGPLMRHYLFDLFLLFCFVVGLLKRHWVLVITSALGLAYLAPFLVVDPCPDWRYQFLNYLTAMVCLAVVLDGIGGWVRRRAQPRPGAIAF